MKKLFFDIIIALRSPFLFTGLKVSNFGVDSSAIRDENNPAPNTLARALIPGDHLRGHLRQNMEFLSSKDNPLVNQLFGNESGKRKVGNTDIEVNSNEPDRGTLQFSDLLQEDAPSSDTFTRIKINDETGVVEDGALQVLELAAPLGKISIFKGTLMVFANEEDASDLEQNLQNAFALIHAMGANKSSGFGEVVHEQSSITLDKTKTAACFATTGAKSHKNKMAFNITFDRPILVDTQRVSENVFRGRQTVPGGAIKGALAYAINMGGGMTAQMSDDLAKVSFSHSFLFDDVDKDKDNKATHKRANRALPFSMFSGKVNGKEVIGDHLKNHEGGAPLLGDKAAVFQSDWKYDTFKLAKKNPQTRRPEPTVNLTEIARTKTAIDYGTNTAEESKLFVTVARASKARRWRFNIEQNDASDANYTIIIQTLLNDLHGIGRTQAVASFTEISIETAPPAPLVINQKNYWPVMLETPAIMSDPTSQRSIDQQYQDYFEGLGLGISLKCHFSDRQMAGDYIPYRFRAFGDHTYQPFELTKAGSVFLLEGSEDNIAQLIKTGLPAKLSKTCQSLTWENCPYVAENGYGAISVDSKLHEDFSLETVSKNEALEAAL